MQVISDRKPSFMDQYGSVLSRNYPIWWATRFDITVAFFLCFIVVFPLVAVLWSNPDFGYTTSDASARLRYNMESRLGFLSLGMLLISLVSAMFWIYAQLNSLQIKFAPRLRRVPWAVSAHIAMLLVALPGLVTYGLALDDYRVTAKYFDEDTFLGGFIAFSFALASLLAVFSVIARRFGFHEALVGLLISIVLMFVIFLLAIMFSESYRNTPIGYSINEYMVLTFGGNDQGLNIVIFLCFWVVMAFFVWSYLRAPSFGIALRYLVLQPAFYGLSAITTCFAVVAYNLQFSESEFTFPGVMIQMFFAYGLSALLTEILYRRTSLVIQRG